MEFFCSEEKLRPISAPIPLVGEDGVHRRTGLHDALTFRVNDLSHQAPTGWSRPSQPRTVSYTLHPSQIAVAYGMLTPCVIIAIVRVNTKWNYDGDASPGMKFDGCALKLCAFTHPVDNEGGVTGA